MCGDRVSPFGGERGWRDVETLKQDAQGFFQKFGNDWALNLSAMLAYNLLGAIFPILLAIISIAGLLLGKFGLQNAVVANLQAILPANVRSVVNLPQVVRTLHRSSGILGIVSVLGLIWGGSNLFSAMEACFDIIFRTKQRSFIQQKLMAIGMVIVFAILVPIMTIASSLSAAASGITRLVPVPIPGLTLILGFAGPVAGLIAGFVLFTVIYTVVPNMELSIHHAWRGAIVSSVLLTVINFAFPFYVSHFVSTQQYGATAGFAIIIMTWFWFFSAILMLGAEVNSFFALGQRPAAGDLPLIMHTVQVHGVVPEAGEDAEAPPEGHTKEVGAAARAPRARAGSVRRGTGARRGGTSSSSPPNTRVSASGMVVLTGLALALSAVAGVAESVLRRNEPVSRGE